MKQDFLKQHQLINKDIGIKSSKTPVEKPKLKNPEKEFHSEGNLNEDDGNYHRNKIARERGYDLTDPRQRKEEKSRTKSRELNLVVQECEKEISINKNKQDF